MLETRIKEHTGRENLKVCHHRAYVEPPTSNLILWEETTVIDRARKWRELLVKEALHIQLTPKGQSFNCDVRVELHDRDVGVELPDC